LATHLQLRPRPRFSFPELWRFLAADSLRFVE
jgi:hypothetical protein